MSSTAFAHCFTDKVSWGLEGSLVGNFSFQRAVLEFVCGADFSSVENPSQTAFRFPGVGATTENDKVFEELQLVSDAAPQTGSLGA